MEHVYNHLLPALSDKPLPENKAAYDLLQSKCELPLPLAPGGPSAGKVYRLHPNKSGWKNVCFDFSEKTGKISYSNRRGSKELIFGLGHAIPFEFPDKAVRPGIEDLPHDTYTNGAWIDERTLGVSVYDISAGFMHLNAVFKGDEVTILICPLTGYRGDYGGYMYGKHD
jgi:hypothetical protein